MPGASFIIKAIEAPPSGEGHSHSRKLRSYEVERRWYRSFAPRCDDGCRVPKFIAEGTQGARKLLALEDLDASGFGRRGRCSEPNTTKACLDWLAHFHATFATERPKGLWPVGTYWHLATRPEEHKTMRDKSLRDAAQALDARLSATSFPTFVHGDAKPDNFCLNHRGDAVATVDFQYIGGGCGMKDVVYFFDCVLEGGKLETQAPKLLDHYFSSLRKAIAVKHPEVDGEALEHEWRALYPLAWADFYRFLAGWAPGVRAGGYVQEMIGVAVRAL